MIFESHAHYDDKAFDQDREELLGDFCRGCGYCMPCPKGVDIPLAFRCYNEMASEGKRSARREYLQCTAFRRETSSASQCVGCGKCEKHCPQQIAVRKELKNAAKALETPVYKAAKGAIQLFKLW